MSYPFHTLLAELTGTRSTKREPLNEAASLDMPIKNQSEEGKVTLADILPDKGADIETAVLSQLEQDEESRLVHEAVDRLPERLREVIELYFFQGVSLVDIAQRWGCTYQNVSGQKAKALQQLRRSSVLQELRREYQAHKRWNAVQHMEYLPDRFDLVQQCRE